MGRRRPWLISGQLAIVFGLLILAWANPNAQDAALSGAFAFVINVATTVQDVAIDGMAVDIIPESEFGRDAVFVVHGGQQSGNFRVFGVDRFSRQLGRNVRDDHGVDRGRRDGCWLYPRSQGRAIVSSPQPGRTKKAARKPPFLL
jgi:hypothetical protein